MCENCRRKDLLKSKANSMSKQVTLDQEFARQDMGGVKCGEGIYECNKWGCLECISRKQQQQALYNQENWVYGPDY